ncbi:MAG: hypothetical protein RMJ53_01815, partial [Chitinophagales bacterium]|nr:hypothetical protein [Chitinophagales bacterium]MDW8272945.1 hypothetical protein [Chitinophagales bacterium]
ITENRILELLVENPASRNSKIKDVMEKPFPVVPLNATAADISKNISKQNTAVITKTNTGEWSIITEFDLIEAMAE